MEWTTRGFQFAVLATITTISLCRPTGVAAQGCEPIRFTTPIDLGGEGQTYQPGREWRLTLAYRNLTSRDWFIGTESSPASAPGGVSPVFIVNTVIADVAYAINDRVRVRLSVPYSSGSLDRIWPDGKRHEQTASGIGDISLGGEMWLGNPIAHENANLALGLGIKAPTGSHTRPSTFYAASGPVAFPADQTIQPGDGGWAVTLQAQGFRRMVEGVFVYGFGSYMASPRAQTEIKQSPASTAANWSVPDVYSARLGAAVAVWPDQGVTLSLGGRLDGIPRRDLFGGGDSTTIKRTARIFFLDPGLSINRGRSTFQLSMPIRVHVNRIKSLLEERSTGQAAVNGGGFAKLVVFAGVSYRP